MKYGILVSSVVILICLGGIYAWSALVPALASIAHLSVAKSQILFGCLFGVFTLSMVLAGKLLDRFGPRPIAMVGGLLFGGGYMIASYSNGVFPWMLLGISLLVGMGTGAGYVCSLTTCMKWFPERRGLVTGISMAGFGGGAVLLSTLAERLFSDGMHVLVMFRWIGLVYGVALLLSAWTLRFPTPGRTARRKATPSIRVLVRDPFFLALVLGMFCGTFAGMLIIGSLKPIALAAGIPALPAAAAISVFAAGNATGRITWGWISDRTDERMIPVKLATILVPLACLLWANSPMFFIVLSFAIGFGFGACFVIYAAQVASQYGLARVAGIYPIVFLAYGVAGMAGPSIGGWMYESRSSYTPAIALSCFVVAAGMAGSQSLLRKAQSPRRCLLS
jgi:OFA family oxalate/formate antiporter-like MFS transporter